MKPSSIVRHSIVMYKGELYTLENKSKPMLLIKEDSAGKRTGIEIDKETELEILFSPAELAFKYLRMLYTAREKEYK